MNLSSLLNQINAQYQRLYVKSEVTATNYTLVLTDAGVYIPMNNAAEQTITVPAYADVPFDTGITIIFEQKGVGQIVVEPDTGVTLNSRSGYSRSAFQHSLIQIYKVATDTWILTGDLA